jgi:hypothetical protein
MNRNIISSMIFFMAISAMPAYGDVIYNDDLIVQGNMCSGNDCVNDMLFDTGTFWLRENNTRIRFLDNSAGDSLGQSWMLIANGNNNGGNAYFQFQLRSLGREDSILYSDGTYPLLDCSMADVSPFTCTVIGLTPVGEPVLVQQAPGSTNTVTSPWYSVLRVAYFGNQADGGVALGADSAVVDHAVSVGRADLQRKIMHVARALAGTDMATLADLNALSSRLDTIDGELDQIERVLGILEGSDIYKSGKGSMSGQTLIIFLAVSLAGLYVRSRQRRRP